MQSHWIEITLFTSTDEVDNRSFFFKWRRKSRLRMGYHKTFDLINDLKQHIEFDSKMSFQSNPIACQFSSYTKHCDIDCVLVFLNIGSTC